MATIAPHRATSDQPRSRSRVARLPHGSGFMIAIGFSTIFWLGVLVLVL
jgi:hypothetical protein